MLKEIKRLQREERTEFVPQTKIVLKHSFSAQVLEVKVKGERISWVSAHSLREEDNSITSSDVEPVQHTLGQYVK